MTKKNTNPEFVERGQRLQSVRKTIGITRAAFSELTGTSANTLRSIESGNRELTAQRARLYSNLFNGLCVSLGDKAYEVSFEYLYHGTKPESSAPKESALTDSDDVRIQNEINAFATNSFYAILNVSDELMSPFYNVGDVVVGKKVVNKKQFQFFKGKICIIEAANGDKLLRRVVQASNRKITTYILNHNHQNADAVEEIEATYIAQAVRHWRLSELVQIPQEPALDDTASLEVASPATI